MAVNKLAFKISGVTENEYKAWCRINRKPAYLPSSKTEFFARIQDGRLRRDKNGSIVKRTRGEQNENV